MTDPLLSPTIQADAAAFLHSDDAALAVLAAQRGTSAPPSVMAEPLPPVDLKGSGLDTGLSILPNPAAAAAVPGSGAVMSIQAEARPQGSGQFWTHNTTGIVRAEALSADRCRDEIAELEAAIFAERKAREDELIEIERQKEIKRQITEEEANADLVKFITQDTFRWSIPNGSEAYSQYPAALEEGARVRPEVPPALPYQIPAMPSPALPLEEQEQQLGERHAALIVKHEETTARRKATEFDMEEALFLDAASSDDSEGFDEDLEAEWRDQTSYIHGICKGFEIDFSNDAAATRFRDLLKEFSAKTHEEVNFSERALIWDTLRLCHRAAQPLHSKHWLSACHEIIAEGSFKNRPSITDYSVILHAALGLQVLTPRQYEKVRRWANRSTYLVRKRVLVLQEFGITEPTWAQVNASVAGLSRPNAKVPTLTLHDTLVALTTASVQQERTGPKSPLLSSTRNSTGGDGLLLLGGGGGGGGVNNAAELAAWEEAVQGKQMRAPPVLEAPELVFHPQQ